MYGKKEKKCECLGECIDSSSVNYVGPNLPGTGIQNNTNLTTALQLIDYEILDIKEELFNLTTTDSNTIFPGITTNNGYTATTDSIYLAQRKGNTLYNILDKYTGEQVTLLKVTGTPTVDNIIYFKLRNEYFKRVGSEIINLRWFGSTVLTQSMFTYTNKTYIVDTDYTLNNTSITIPSNCTIEFRVGKISNGTINFSTGCNIKNQKIGVIFYEVLIRGYLDCEIRSSYFFNANDDILFNSLTSFRTVYLEKSIYLEASYTLYYASDRRIENSFDLIGIGNVTISTRRSVKQDIALNSKPNKESPGSGPIQGYLIIPNQSIRFTNLNFVDIEYNITNDGIATWEDSVDMIAFFNQGAGLNNSIFLENCNFKMTGTNVTFNVDGSAKTTVSMYAKNCIFESLAWPSLGIYSHYQPCGIKEIIIDNCEIRNGVTFINKQTETNKSKIEFKNCVTNGWFEMTTPNGLLDNLDNLDIYFNNCKSNDINNPFTPSNTEVTSENELSSANIFIDQCQFEYISNICRGYKNVTIQNTSINLSKYIDLQRIQGNLKFKNVKLDRSDSSAYMNLKPLGNIYLDNVEEIISGNSNIKTKSSILKISKGVVKDFFNIKSSINYLDTDFYIGDNTLSYNTASANCIPIILNDIDSCDNGNPYSIYNGCIFGTKTIPFTSTTNSNILIIDFDVNVISNCASKTVSAKVYFQNKTDSTIKYGLTINSKVVLFINNRSYEEKGAKDLISTGNQHCRLYFSTGSVYIDIDRNPIIFYLPNFLYSPINLEEYNLIISNTNQQIDISNIKILQL